MRAYQAVVASVALGASLILVSASASAHFQLKAPLPSNAQDDSGGKGGFPCGPDAPSAVITPVQGGSQLTITVEETVFHPGFYRVALSLNKSNADIAMARKAELPKDNVVYGANDMVLMPTGPGNSVRADFMNPPVFPVLADNLFPHTTNDKNFTGMVTLPNVTCERCTLQVIEFMAQHGPDYFYRHCADLKITADPTKPIEGAGGSGGSGAGGSAGSGGSGGAGGAAGGSAGAGGAAGGAPGTAGAGGAASVAGSGGALLPTGGSAAGGAPSGVSGSAAAPAAPAADEGGCSLAAAGSDRSRLVYLAASLLGLVGLLRRRNRAG